MKLLLVAVGKMRSHGLKLQQGDMDKMLLDLLEWLEELSESWPSKAEVSALRQIEEPRCDCRGGLVGLSPPRGGDG